MGAHWSGRIHAELDFNNRLNGVHIRLHEQRGPRYTLEELLAKMPEVLPTDEGWVEMMAPGAVGREFGSNYYERLAELDARLQMQRGLRKTKGSRDNLCVRDFAELKVMLN